MKLSSISTIAVGATFQALALGSPVSASGPWPQELGAQEIDATEARLPVAPLTGFMPPPWTPEQRPEQRPGAADTPSPLDESREASAIPPDLTIDRERLYFNEREDATWVRGATYKASVAEGGFTYIPFLGSAAPKNFPVSFRLESATVGPHSLDLEPLASVDRQGDRFVLDRGPVDVIYDFGLRQVEQSLSVDTKGVEGDLVLTLAVTTGLTATADGAGFRFDGPHGGMAYGAATVFDGVGRSAAVPATLNGTSLVLTVPAAFLEGVSGPVLVDPILFSYTVDGAVGFQRRVDVAYDHTRDAFMYVFEDQYSGNDVDVYYHLAETATGTDIAFGYVDSSSEDWTAPSIAIVNATDTALVAVTREIAAAGTVSVVGRIYDLTTLDFYQGLIPITPASTNVDRENPDVGGSSSPTSGDLFIVVWEADYGPDSDIQWRTIDSNGVLGAGMSLDSSLDDNSFKPAVSKSSGQPGVYGAWNIGFLNQELANTQYTVKVARVDTTGNLIDSGTVVRTVAQGALIHELDVSDGILPIDASVPVFAVVYDQFASILGDTFVTFVRSGASGTSARSTFELQRSEHADRTADQGGANIATTAQEFLVTYLEHTFTELNTYATAFDYTEDQFLSISERRTWLGDLDLPGAILGTRGPGLASRFSGGNFGSRYIAVAREEGSYAEPDIASSIFFVSNAYSPAYQYCYGNPNSTGDRGFIRMEGNRSSTDSKRLVASALPPHSFGYFLASRSASVIANPNGSSGDLCVAGTSVGRYSNFVATTGAEGVLVLDFDPTSISQPNGAVTGLAGQAWNFQAWYRDQNSGVLTSNFTNACSLFLD